MNEEKLMELEKRLNYIEFRQDLIFNNSPVDRILYEYEITKTQYELIMDLMEKYRAKIDSNEEIHHASFEREMYQIIPQHDGNYHFVESLTRAFWENDRWEEVFNELYRVLPKYQYIKKGY